MQPHSRSAAALAALAVAALAGACVRQPLTLGHAPGAWHPGNAAANAEALFESPEQLAVVATFGREALPELARNDALMGAYDPAAPLATAQWPDAPRPDATRIRHVYYVGNPSSSSYAVPVHPTARQRQHHHRAWHYGW